MPTAALPLAYGNASVGPMALPCEPDLDPCLCFLCLCSLPLLVAGQHSSLIADPTSAYYQLVHLQESHMRGTDTEEGQDEEAEVGASGDAEAAERSSVHEEAPLAVVAQGETWEGVTAAATAPSKALAEEAAAGGGLPGSALQLPLSTNGPALETHPEAAGGASEGTGATESSPVDVEKGGVQKRVEMKKQGSFGARAAKSLRRRLSSKGGRGTEGAGKEGGEEVEEEEEPQGPDVPLKRVLPLNKPEWPLALLAILAAAGNGLMFPVFSILLSRIIPVFYEPDPEVLRRDANFWSIMFVVLAASVFVLMVAQNVLFGIIGSQLIRRVRRLCFSAVLRQEVAWFDQPKNSRSEQGPLASVSRLPCSENWPGLTKEPSCSDRRTDGHSMGPAPVVGRVLSRGQQGSERHLLIDSLATPGALGRWVWFVMMRGGCLEDVLM